MVAKFNIFTLEPMTYTVVSFHTTKTDLPGTYHVAFKGDDRFRHKLEVQTQADLGVDALDYVELYGIWFYLMGIQYAGMMRSSKNLRLVVSRGAIKRLLRETSSKSHLFQFTNAIRTQFFGLFDIEVDKNPSWVTDLDLSACVKWDGTPPPYPAESNPIAGPVEITYHALERYYETTNKEGRADLIFQKVCRIVREATTQMTLPEDVQRHKSLKYGDRNKNDLYLTTKSGWQAVVSESDRGNKYVATVYMRK